MDVKICIYGPGAIGGHLAVRLAQSGCDLSVIARGATLEAIRRDGLSLTSGDERLSARVPATDRPEELPIQDIVIVTVKTPALPGIAEGLAALCGPDTAVVYCLNGLPWWYLDRMQPGAAWSAPVAAMIEALRPVCDPRRVIGAIAYSGNHLTGPGQVVCTNPGSSRFFFRETDPLGTPACEALVALLRQPGCQPERSADFEAEIWKKLSLNCVSGPVGALTGMTTGLLLNYPPLRGLVGQALAEVQALAAACGKPDAAVSLEVMSQSGGGHKSSMLQDYEAGRQPEIETLIGALCDLAGLQGVPVPTLQSLLALARARACQLGLLPNADCPVEGH